MAQRLADWFRPLKEKIFPTIEDRDTGTLTKLLGIPHQIAQRLGWSSLPRELKTSLTEDPRARETWLRENRPELDDQTVAAASKDLSVFRQYVRHPAWEAYNRATSFRIGEMEQNQSRWFQSAKDFLTADKHTKKAVEPYLLQADQIGRNKELTPEQQWDAIKQLGEQIKTEKPEVYNAWKAWQDTAYKVWGDFTDYFKSLGTPNAEIDALRRQLGIIPGYFPHVRKGNYHVVVTDAEGTTIHREGRQFGYQASKLKEQLEQQYPGQEVKITKVKQLPEEVYWGLDKEHAAQLAKAALSRVPGADAKEVEGIINSLVAQEVQSRGFGRHFISQRNIPGYETTGLADIAISHLQGAAGFLAKMKAAPEYIKALNEISARREPGTYSALEAHIRDSLANQGALDQTMGKLRGGMFTYYLAFLPKSALVNLTGNHTSFSPYLSQFTKGADRIMAKAEIDVARDLKNVRELMAGGDPEFKHLTPEESAALKEGLHSGMLNDQMTQEIFGAKLDNLPFGVGKVLNGFNTAGRYLFGEVEKFNREASFLAGYRVFREKGLPAAEAIQKTLDAISSTHGLYERYNMPLAVKDSATGKVARSTVYAFKFYSHNQTAMLRYLFEHDKGALGKALMNLGIIGGLTAIPGVQALNQTYQYFTGKNALLEAKKDVPEEVYTLMRYGLPGLAGVDLSGSVSLNMLDMGGGSPMAMAAGAPGKILENAGKGIEFYQRGDNLRALESVAPMFVKYPMQAYREHNEGMTTKRGQPLADLQGQPNKLTLQEALGKAGGFQPISKSNQFDVRQVLEQTKKEQNDFGDKLASQMLQAIKNKDQAGMQDLVQQLAAYNQQAVSRGLPPLDLMERVKQRLMPKMVEKKWYPYASQFERK